MRETVALCEDCPRRCEHGNPPPWWDCDQCKADAGYGFTGFAEGGAAFSEKPLVLGENLTTDGTVRK